MNLENIFQSNNREKQWKNNIIIIIDEHGRRFERDLSKAACARESYES